MPASVATTPNRIAKLKRSRPSAEAMRSTHTGLVERRSAAFPVSVRSIP